jgi:hypothetical protein
VDDKDERPEPRKLRQARQQLAHVVLGHLAPQHRVEDARVDAVRRPQGEPGRVVAHQRDLAHEVQRPVQPLDEQVRLQQQDVPRHVDELGRLAQRQGLVVVENKGPALPADGSQRRGRLGVHVGEHQPLMRWCFLLRVGRIQDLVHPRLRQGELPDHVPDLGREPLELGEAVRGLHGAAPGEKLVIVHGGSVCWTDAPSQAVVLLNRDIS